MTDTVQIQVVADAAAEPVIPDALRVSPVGLVFDMQPGSTQRLAVENVNALSPVTWTAMADQPWIELSQSTGATPDAIAVTLKTLDGLATANYSATLTLTNAAVPEDTVRVRVNVTNPAIGVDPEPAPGGTRVFLPAIVRSQPGGW